MPKFEKLRVSLARPDAPPLLEGMKPEDAHRSREDFLTEMFSDRRDFLHSASGASISFVPITEAPKGYVAGFFGRQSKISTHDGPEAQFKDMSIEGWDVSVFVMDTADDSQIAWMQYNGRVGSPRPVLQSFFDYHRRRTEFRDWRAFVEYMEYEVEYWKVIGQYRQQISEISFTFLPPNALKAEDAVTDFLNLAKGANSETVKHTYNSEPGAMNPDSDVMKASAEISSEGGGETEVKATLDGRKKVVYTSSSFRATDDVSEDDMPTPKNPGFIKNLLTKVFGL